MTDSSLRVACSKGLALVRRAAPVGDSLSPAELRQSPLLFKGGWVPLAHVLQRQALRAFSSDFVLEVVNTSTFHSDGTERLRFELMTHAEHGQLIRARYGHRFDIVRIVARLLSPSISPSTLTQLDLSVHWRPSRRIWAAILTLS